MVAEDEIEAVVDHVEDENEEVVIKGSEVQDEIVGVATEPAASSSRSVGVLNAAWGSFMKRAAGAGSHSSANDNLEGKKRGRSLSPEMSKKKVKGESVHGPTGLSKAAQAEKRYKDDLDAGKFDAKKMAKFKKACLAVDALAEFNPERLRGVRCSNCAIETACAAQSGAPNPHRFIEHHQKCIKGDIRIAKIQRAAAKTRTLTSGVFKGFQKLSAKVTHSLMRPKRDTPSTIPTNFPCPGITEADNPKVAVYLRRSSALGGGARSIIRIAKDIFGSPFKSLSAEQKNQVIDKQDSEHTWKNNHRRMNCRSTSCLQVSINVTESGRILPCSNCREFFRSKPFHAVLNRKPPNSKGLRHVNERFQNRLLAHQWSEAKGLRELVESAVSRSFNVTYFYKLSFSKEEGSIYTRFAQGAVSGKYKDYGVFLGLLHAMVQKQDKDERGVGMQNFQYCPDWDQFMHIASIHSPRTHEFIREHFPGRTKRSFQYVLFCIIGVY